LVVGLYIVAAGTTASAALTAFTMKDARDYRAKMDRDQKQRDDAYAKERAEQAEASKSHNVSIKNYCSANGFSYNCTFTNMHPQRATPICSHGKLAQKANPGVTLLSMPTCSGTLEPMETKQVSAPWIGGDPDAVCNKPNGYGGTVLDWSTCLFNSVED
jgi:hypothetical protein